VIIGGHGKKRTPALAARFANEFNLPFASTEVANAQFALVDAAAREIGRDPAEIVRSVALVVAVGRDDGDVTKRAAAIGRDVEGLKAAGLAGTPAEVVDTIGRWREQTGITRLYLQVLDLADLDHIEFIASEVAPQLA
jgi:alkanesulfonate monooxygenase SsuD/methylene tetrahydromethanopterin reductase-like flavin-dependent oxidoreductase (luciferase family)